ncbi:MAG: glycosyl hydrolase 2 galactose-binding domain-containing protein [Terriglobia bacterium]
MRNDEKPFSAGHPATRRDFLKASASSVFVMLAPQSDSPAPSLHQTELRTQWKITSARNVSASDAEVSKPSFDTSSWVAIRRTPTTVLQALEDAGVYKDLYFGMNLTQKTPPDLWKQDWWYRTTFDAPPAEVHSLIFNGINYRADVWLNGRLIADKRHVV